MEERTIDHLLEQYLHLLHEYTSLRAELNKLQAGLYQNLARANFAAERGMRYGQDQYDDRMQASRRVVVLPSSVCPTFEVVKVDDDDDGAAVTTTEKTAQASVSKSEAVASEEGKVAQGGPNSREGEAAEGPEGGEGMKEEEAAAEPIASSVKGTEPKTSEPKAKKNSNDPLRWFGLITPMPLRQAQAQSVQAVGDIVPRLVSINAEMAQVEIEVRRARKKRAKAEAAARKSEDVASKEDVAV
ncbi:hypothetical protein PG985_007308 [Apiospora marii]|uniref:Vacuolar ATPase assembly protein VMA22 n=1 Tax=Apiospora marii TaxID=335849 RepID=A0ABR1SRA1_9PEZI